MILDLTEFSTNQVYYTFISTIIPRPIAWVLSDNGNDSLNLAPFSYFNGVSSNPPLIMLSTGKKPDGSRKDTWVNIDERKYFTVHIAHRELAEKVTASSAGLPHGQSELNNLNLPITEVEDFPLPRLSDCRIAFFCEKYQIMEIGNTPQGLILGLVTKMYISDEVASINDGKLAVDPTKVDPLGRIGGNDYSLFGDTITVPRPK